MTTPQENDLVTIAFTGKLDNGELFYTVTEKEPMQVRIGNSDLPPTLENALCKMVVGQETKIRVPPEEGYGHRQKLLLQTIKNQEMVDALNPKPGMVVSLNVDRDGEPTQVPATIISIEDDEITVDYNHPLAGHHLNYQLRLLAIDKD